jgi:hypothetical protein
MVHNHPRRYVMRRLLLVAGITLVVASCTESQDAIFDPIAGPQFNSTDAGVCRKDDQLTAWTVGEDPDKNGNGWVCVDSRKRYYDDRLTKEKFIKK